jgi:hypothetical protein
VRWAYRIEDKTGTVADVLTGNITLDLGVWNTAKALTLDQIRTAAINKLNADLTIPAHDSAS